MSNNWLYKTKEEMRAEALAALKIAKEQEQQKKQQKK